MGKVDNRIARYSTTPAMAAWVAEADELFRAQHGIALFDFFSHTCRLVDRGPRGAFRCGVSPAAFVDDSAEHVRASRAAA